MATQPMSAGVSKRQVCLPERSPSPLGLITQDSPSLRPEHTGGTNVPPTMPKHRAGGQLGPPTSERKQYLEKVP